MRPFKGAAFYRKEEEQMATAKMTGQIWQHYQNIVKERVIPYQWQALNDQLVDTEPSHGIENFRLAAGLTEGTYYGMVFQDSDVYKWLESVAYSLRNHPDPSLEAQADDVIELLGQAQLADGYLNTYYQVQEGLDQRWTNIRDNHELYCAGHLIEAAVAYYEVTGKGKLLEIAQKFADYIDQTFGPEQGKIQGYPGHEEIELSLVRLYVATEKKNYLKLATYFVNERGKQPLFFDLEAKKAGRKERGWWHGNHDYAQAHLPVRDQKEAVGHAVRAVYFYAAVADIARLTQDDSLKAAVSRLWENVVQHKLFINGGIGASAWGEAFAADDDLPNDTTYNETCASVGLAFWARRMLELAPKGEYGDVLENAIYNGSLCGMDIQGERFLYVNPLEINGPNACQRHDHRHVTPQRQKWFNCACCPPNLARLIGSIGDYFITESSEGVYVNLYGSSEVSVSLGGQAVVLTQETLYPWAGEIRIIIGTASTVTGKVSLRIPAWSQEKFQLSVNGVPVSCQSENGYVTLQRSWADGDVIELVLDMRPQKIYAHTRITEDIGKVAITRGPLVYVAEERDNGDQLGTLWLADGQIAAIDNSELLSGAIYLKAPGKRLMSQTSAIYTREMPTFEDTTITMLPYFLWGNRGTGELRVWLNHFFTSK